MARIILCLMSKTNLYSAKKSQNESEAHVRVSR